MSNNEILEELIDKFGLVQTLLFCRIEAHKYQKLHLESVKSKNVNVENAFDYESSWWEQAFNDLNNRITNEQNEYIEFAGTTF